MPAARRGHRQAERGGCRRRLWWRTSPNTGPSWTWAASTACLHVTDMAWRRVNDPKEVLSIGETIKVQVIKVNKDTHRISLGIETAAGRSVGCGRGEVPRSISVHTGRVTNHHRLRRLPGAGAGGRGSRARLGNVLDQEERPSPARSSPPRKRSRSWCWRSTTQASRVAGSQADHGATPWEVFAEQYPVGKRRSRVKSRTSPSSVCLVGLDNDIDGMVPPVRPDLGRSRRGRDRRLPQGRHGQGRRHRGRHRQGGISLSIKAVEGDPLAEVIGGVKRGSIITVAVTAIEDGGIEVEYEGMKSFHPPLRSQP